ncbi:MAG: hypothetical protein J7L38_03510 [Thermoproteales archaeon]|nr:hypothetical protein [Thermoproteales archaeon]
MEKILVESRKNIKSHVKCQACNRIVPKGKYCIYCGSELSRVEPIFSEKELKEVTRPETKLTLFDKLQMLEEELYKLKKEIQKRKTIIVVRSNSKFIRIRNIE